MGSPFDDWRFLKVPGGQKDGTLSTGEVEVTLAEGVWEMWADQSYYVEVHESASVSLNAKPTAKPANSFTYIGVGLGDTKYARFKRIATSGTFYANLIANPVNQ